MRLSGEMERLDPGQLRQGEQAALPAVSGGGRGLRQRDQAILQHALRVRGGAAPLQVIENCMYVIKREEGCCQVLFINNL